MKRIICAGRGLLFLLLLIGGSVANAQEAAEQEASNSDAPVIQSEGVPPASAPSDEEASDETPIAVTPPREPSQSRARGLRIDEDGFIYGQLVFIDPHSLDQVPVANAVVTFIQQQSIIAQAKTGVDGIFTVKGLAPYATYSMFVRSDAWMCIFGTYVTPEDVSPEDGGQQAAQVRANKLVFASFQQGSIDPNTLDSATGDPKYHAIQVIPWQDFLVAMHLGIFGDICGQDCGCASCGGACCGGGVAGGAGGGGAGAGYGAAAAAAWAAAATAWGSGVGTDDDELASPFAP